MLAVPPLEPRDEPPRRARCTRPRAGRRARPSPRSRDLERRDPLPHREVEELEPGADEPLNRPAVEPREPREFVVVGEVERRDDQLEHLRVLGAHAVVLGRREAELAARAVAAGRASGRASRPAPRTSPRLRRAPAGRARAGTRARPSRRRGRRPRARSRPPRTPPSAGRRGRRRRGTLPRRRLSSRPSSCSRRTCSGEQGASSASSSAEILPTARL